MLKIIFLGLTLKKEVALESWLSVRKSDDKVEIVFNRGEIGFVTMNVADINSHV